jgi:1,4-alpha-glucan branching enzyme
MIGGGPKAEALKQHAEATGYMDDIHFTGYVPTVYPFLPAFDVAVFPSLWEGFGLTPVEAMIAKVPVVASDIPVFREIIGDGGILVESKNPTQIAAGVTSLLSDGEKSEEIGKRGYERATSEYAIGRTVREYEQLYRELYT